MQRRLQKRQAILRELAVGRSRMPIEREIHMSDADSSKNETASVKYAKFVAPVTLKSDGSNYVSWAITLEALIRAEDQDYWKYLSTDPGPIKGDSVQFTMYVILHSIEPLIIQKLYQGKTEEEKTNLSSGKKLWTAIKAYCQGTTGASETAAFGEFTVFEYDDSLPVEENLTKFERLVNTIQLTGTTIPDKLVQAQLLRSLCGDQWNSFKSSVSGNPPPPPRQVFDTKNSNNWGNHPTKSEQGLGKRNDSSHGNNKHRKR